MRFGTVIGRVVLSRRHESYVGERLMLVSPWKQERFAGDKEAHEFAIVVYDELGAAPGQTIAISEGREAACPFDPPRPVDAYCAALVDEYFYQGKTHQET
ncbi:EutN/CcmL family microcompartment protein [Kamptonema cortianum]|nr:EutN/CcmL family microcompartment protein [Oscillatoria laete-virens]MDK3156434.1 EutN/CcmL family microcompartment protein [Kamptonema cortianum]MDL5046293.1 EutN/CcmL family microcompartment protein [Oscillatoria amoena NRMC-F 0135]MDL5053885.1 EutN/CcmL family microcompartment protein [Oscillatoria laete-virens NRMC-F 0139]